jgi:peptide/nickel transport system permease protein
MRMHPVLRTVLRRLALGIITLFAVSILVFSMVEFLPGDFATQILGQSATPETVKAFEHEIGIRPTYVRYIEWIDKFAHGDFGSSYASRADYRRTVAEIVVPRLKNTLFLASMTAIIAVPLALLLGIMASLYRNSWFGRIDNLLTNLLTLTTISSPEFFVAYILMLYLP